MKCSIKYFHFKTEVIIVLIIEDVGLIVKLAKLYKSRKCKL